VHGVVSATCLPTQRGSTHVPENETLKLVARASRRGGGRRSQARRHGQSELAHDDFHPAGGHVRAGDPHPASGLCEAGVDGHGRHDGAVLGWSALLRPRIHPVGSLGKIISLFAPPPLLSHHSPPNPHEPC